MPLIKSASDKARSANIAAEIRSGKPREQALAIAYRVQRDAKKRGMAAGGSVPWFTRSQARNVERAGMIRSPIAGRTDRINMGVKPGAYVMPADVVSGIGQGNSMSGANALNQLFKMGPGGAAMPSPKIGSRGMMRGRRGFADGGAAEQPVDIVAAGGEFIVPVEKVMEIGHGDIDHGHAVLDEMVKQIRANTIKDLRKLPGPRKS